MANKNMQMNKKINNKGNIKTSELKIMLLMIIIITIMLLIIEKTITRTREEVLKIMIMIITMTDGQNDTLEKKETLIRTRNWSG